MSSNDDTYPLKIARLPKRCEIELSASCNLACRYCPRRHLGKLEGFMDTKLFTKIVDELSVDPKTILVLHRRGESLLHPEFLDILRYIRGKFETIQIATNATRLDDNASKALIETVSFVSFSLDSPLTFTENRPPAKYAEVEKNVANFLASNKGRVNTQVSMVKTPKTTRDAIDRFVSDWRGRVDRVRIYEAHSLDGHFGSLGRNRPDRVPCVMPFYEIQVAYDGKVRRCNHDWDGATLGDLNLESVERVWSGESYRRLRRQHMDLKFDDEPCRSCGSWYPAEGQQATGEVYE